MPRGHACVTKMDRLLDDGTGGDVRRLPDLLRSLERERDGLQDQVNHAGGEIRARELEFIAYTASSQLAGRGSEVGSSREEWRSIVRDVNAAVGELEGLRVAMTTRDVALATREGGGMGLGLVEEGVGECVDDLRPLVEELKEVERVRAYLVWARRVSGLR